MTNLQDLANWIGLDVNVDWATGWTGRVVGVTEGGFLLVYRDEGNRRIEVVQPHRVVRL